MKVCLGASKVCLTALFHFLLAAIASDDRDPQINRVIESVNVQSFGQCNREDCRKTRVLKECKLTSFDDISHVAKPTAWYFACSTLVKYSGPTNG